MNNKKEHLAFEELLKGEGEKLYKIAFLHMQNKEDTLDVLQEATCKAYLAIGQLKEPAYFSTWLIKILIRSAYKELERKKKLITLPEETITYILESNQVEEPTFDLTESLATLKPASPLKEKAKKDPLLIQESALYLYN